MRMDVFFKLAGSVAVFCKLAGAVAVFCKLAGSVAAFCKLAGSLDVDSCRGCFSCPAFPFGCWAPRRVLGNLEVRQPLILTESWSV